jgi:tungstate transport system substrate-binding protein
MKYILLFTFLIFAFNFHCNAETANENQTPISTDVRAVKPTEVYGPKDAEIALMLGNGGAGPTCLLQELTEDFIQSNKLNIQIGWVQTITRLTLENLKDKVIDVSLTYEEQPEMRAVQEGWASDRTLVFNDHFILVGPKNNPANVKPTDSIEEAFAKIVKTGSLFFSRNDLSGTNERERSIWNTLNIQPWEKMPLWYVTEQVFPADALKRSDKEGCYTLTDRGTLIAMQESLKSTAVYVQNGNELMNRCHAMLQKEPSAYAKQFLSYLKSAHAQALIEHYPGKNKKECVDCCPLFTPAKADKFLQANCLENLGFSPNS